MALAGLLARLGLRQRGRDKALYVALQPRLREISASLVSQRDAVDGASRDAVEQQQRVLEELQQRLEALRLEDLRGSLSTINLALRRELRYNKAFQAHRRTHRRPVSPAIAEQLARIAASPEPIVVGPWTGDLALELLYWAPFVRWFSRHFGVPPERLHVVSRGGAPWYRDVAGHYVDLLSLASDADASGGTVTTDWERVALTDEMASRLIGDDPGQTVLRPSLMFTLFEPFWRHDAPVQLVERFTAPRRLPPPAMELPDLPAQFIATRFAFSSSFPETSENRAWLDQLLGCLLQSGDIVWLGAGAGGADGESQTPYIPPADARLHRIDHLLTPERAVETHAAVIARSAAYVGTYGGLAYVASYYDVPSITFYAVRDFFPHYRRVADHALGVDMKAPIVLHVADDDLFRTMLGFSSAAETEG